MEEQLISYETAVLTKERGFNWECNDAYVDYRPFEDVYEQPINYQTPQNHNSKEHKCSIPTQALLQRWLREVHKIDVLPILRSSGKYSYDIYHYDTPNQIGERTRYTCMNSFGNYEKCLELGLQEALKLII